jgi:hypothetical protein
MGHDVGPQARRRVFEAVLRGRPHHDTLPSPREQGAQLFRRRVGQRAGRRPHGRRIVGHGAGIEGIGWGQLSGRFGTVPDLAGVDHHEGQGGRSQCRDDGPLVAPGGFKHNQRGLHSLEPGDEGGNPRCFP